MTKHGKYSNSPSRLTLDVGHSGYASLLTFSPDGAVLASTGYDQRVILWNTETGSIVDVLAYFPDGVNGLQFAPDGSLIIVPADDAPVHIWNGTPSLIKADIGGFYPVAFSSDGRLMAAFDVFKETGCVLIWDTLERKPIQTVELGGQPWNLAISPDTIAVIDLEEEITVLDLLSGRRRWKLNWEMADMPSVAFSYDGQSLAVGGMARTVILDAENCNTMRTLDQPLSRVESVCFSPGDDLLATADSAGTLALWDTATWRPGHILRAYADHLAFSPDGRVIAGPNRKGDIDLWDVKT